MLSNEQLLTGAQIMVLECEYCGALVEAEILKAYVAADPNGDAPAFKFSLAKCPKCQAPFLIQEEEDVLEGWQAPERLYPPTDFRLPGAIPKPIQAAFEEAARCIRAKAFTAAAIMCRKTLEGICAAHGATEGSLVKSLQKLRDDGTIDRRLFEWADALRLFGNEAAHDVDVVIASQDAADILDFTRALLEYVFTFRERFETFKKRRSAGQAGS